MQQIASGPVPLYGWPVVDPAVLRVAVTSRYGGVSTSRFASLNLGLHVGDDADAVLTNRLRAAAAFGVALDECVFAEQIAGSRVARVGGADRGRGARSQSTAIPACDALVTCEPGVTLAMMAADCMMLALADPAAGVLATVHAGWPGATNGIIGAAVAELVAMGADPGRIHVVIGPAVPGERYQVGAEVADAARSALGARSAEAIRPDGTGRYLFDLVAAARIQLRRAGIPAGQVHAAAEVTGPATPFYSHRFEGPTGRFALFAQLATEVAA